MKQINLYEIKWLRIAFLIAFVLLAILNFAQCENNRTATATITALNSKVSTYKLKNGDLVTTQKTLLLDNRQLKDLIVSQDAELAEMYKKFSEVKTVTKIVTITKIDSVDVPFEIRVPVDFERKDFVKHKNYSFNYLVNQDGLKLTDFEIPDTMKVITGTKRKWFWGKETATIDITNTNELINISDIQHIEVTEKKKWYNTTGAKLGAGVIAIKIIEGLLKTQ